MDHLSKPELLALLGAARTHSERDWLMILIGYWHGLRASEVVGLQADNFKDGFLKVARLKGSLRTVQPLVEDENPLLNERKALFAFLQKAKRNQRLFPVTRQHFWRIVQRHSKTAGIPAHKRHPHILKHSIAMQAIDSAGIHKVQQYLGHKSLSSTGAYLKVSDADASAAIRTATRGSLAV